MNHVELVMRRRSVREFIKADPIDLVISRKTEPIKNTETGGYTGGELVTLSSQLARIVLNKRRYNPGIINAEAGDIPHTDYLLIGMHGLNVQKDDEFQWRGEYYRVIGIHKQRTESTLASIDMLGPKNRG